MKGLIIKKEWLKKIFDIAKPKSWEVRGTNTSVRGKIKLIESGSKTIVGETYLVDCIPLSKKVFDENRDKHQIPKPYHSIPYAQPYAWVFENTVQYIEPIPYEHKRGSVIWVNLED